jgi:hypothetical protein
MENYKYLLLISDSNILANGIIKVFKNNSCWKICIIDSVKSDLVDKFIYFDSNKGFEEENVKKLYSEIESFSNKFEAIIHICGGWEKSSIKSVNIFSQSDNMFKKNYYYSLLSCNY